MEELYLELSNENIYKDFYLFMILMINHLNMNLIQLNQELWKSIWVILKNMLKLLDLNKKK
jgi:hypothetical protein